MHEPISTVRISMLFSQVRDIEDTWVSGAWQKCHIGNEGVLALISCRWSSVCGLCLLCMFLGGGGHRCHFLCTYWTRDSSLSADKPSTFIEVVNKVGFDKSRFVEVLGERCMDGAPVGEGLAEILSFPRDARLFFEIFVKLWEAICMEAPSVSPN